MTPDRWLRSVQADAERHIERKVTTVEAGARPVHPLEPSALLGSARRAPASTAVGAGETLNGRQPRSG